MMNAFDVPEGNITETNYDEMVNHFNLTSPGILAGLNLKTCDLNLLLSEVNPRLTEISEQNSKFIATYQTPEEKCFTVFSSS